MGVIIKKNTKGEYKMKSSISDESYHPSKKWISENEAKAVLIDNELNSFVDKVIQIDMDFPNGYRVNDLLVREQTLKGFKWIIDNAYGEGASKRISDAFSEITKRLNLDFELNLMPSVIESAMNINEASDNYGSIVSSVSQQHFDKSDLSEAFKEGAESDEAREYWFNKFKEENTIQ